MPDESKLAALDAARFRVLPTCGTCAQGAFTPMSGWGRCAKITYQHGKHVGDARLASVPRSGTCPAHELDARDANDYDRSGFTKFLEVKQ